MAKKKEKEDNLKPFGKGRSKEEAREAGRKGGIASGKARRQKKELKECCEAVLQNVIKNKAGEELSGAEAMVLAQFQKALRGDAKAFELIRDTAGQKPVDKVQVAEVDQDTIDEMRLEMEKRKNARANKK